MDVHLATDGSYVDDLGVRCPGTQFGAKGVDAESANSADYLARMNGQSVILQASRKIVAASQRVLERNSLAAADVRWMVPHQANANLLAQVARGLRFPTDKDGVVSVLEDTGNTSSASMGIALDTLRRSGRIQSGDYLLLPAFGAGFTWGAGLCRASV
jgi:3-oxoacyl-[acyl-carrier-protein] synthase-3